MASALPFDKPGSFYRGNLHLHSTLSDGRLSPADTIQAYIDQGYDFVSLTEHFLPNSVWNRGDGYCGVADTINLRREGFTTILGAELHGPGMENGEHWHILANGLPLDFAPRTEGETGPQLAARAKLAGAYVSIAHPYWNGLSIADAYTLLEYADAVEVYNHGCEVEVDRGDSWHYTDILLGERYRLNAIATDDAHFSYAGDRDRDAFGGWVHVKAESLDPDALLTALKAGHFYSSTGPQIHDIQIKGNTLSVTCSPADRILVTGLGSKSDRVPNGPVEEGEFDLERFRPGGYIRVTVLDANGGRAWSNPIWFDDLEG